MANNKTFTMEISIDMLEKRLKDLFKSAGEQHAKLIADTIIGNLNTTEVGLKQLYLAFTGYEEPISFLPGDEVMINSSSLYSWNIDKDSMEKAGYIVDGKLKAIVLSINKYKKENIQVEYDRIKAPGVAVDKYTQFIEAKHLTRSGDCKIVTPDVGDMI